MASLSDILNNHPDFSEVILSSKPFRKLDFSKANNGLLTRDLSETSVFSEYIFNEMLANHTFTGVGGYNENRVIYRQKEHFVKQQEKPRSIHLGTDIWTKAGEPVYAPLDGEVHSFAFNNYYGDYGPTIILKHELASTEFFTLYGHLSLDSLNGLYKGKSISSGEKIALIGNYPVNGDWPPHLHFQLMADMGSYKGDFPGVCSIEDRDHYLSICPDPNLILRIRENE